MTLDQSTHDSEVNWARAQFTEALTAIENAAVAAANGEGTADQQQRDYAATCLYHAMMHSAIPAKTACTVFIEHMVHNRVREFETEIVKAMGEEIITKVREENNG